MADPVFVLDGEIVQLLLPTPSGDRAPSMNFIASEFRSMKLLSALKDFFRRKDGFTTELKSGIKSAAVSGPNLSNISPKTGFVHHEIFNSHAIKRATTMQSCGLHFPGSSPSIANSAGSAFVVDK